MNMELKVSFACFFSAVFLCFLAWLVNKYINFRIKNLEENLPDDIIIPLPPFNGRILRNCQVSPGTFFLMVDFSEISFWGKDAILTYGVRGDYVFSSYEVILQAWRPDPHTAGAFQKAQLKITAPKFWGKNYRICGAVLKEGNIIASAWLKDEFKGSGYIVLFLCFAFILFTISLVTGISGYFCH